MDYKFMTKEEVEISKIKNIRYIKIYDLFDNPWNKNRAVTSIIINYVDERNNLKYLNYCEKDKEFDFFVNKVIETYLNEKDNGNIKFGNSETKEIIENNLQIGHQLPLEKYIEKKGNKKILNYLKDEINSYKNIIIYYIKQINKLFDNTVTVEDKIYGNRELFSIKVIKNGKEVFIPFKYQKLNNGIEITLNNIISPLDFVVLNINYMQEKINISWKIENSNLVYDGMIDLNGEIKEYLVKDDKTIFYNQGKLKNDITIDEVDLLNNIDKSIDYNFYKLPWNDYLVSKISILEYPDYQIETYDVKYVNVSDCYINLLEYYSKFYKKYDKKVLLSTMKLDGMKRVLEIYLVNDLALVLNTFMEVPSSLSKYKTRLEGKTFYEVAKLNEDSLLKLNNLVLNDIDLSKITHQNDLLDDKVLKLMIRGN